MTSEKYEMTPDERLDYDFQIDNWEWHATEHRFDALLDIAAEVCLREPLPTIERVEPTSDQRIVSTGGLHALRIALELELKQELWPNYDSTDEKDLVEGNFWIAMDAPLKLSPDKRDPINFTIAKKVEQFGKALINEAFEVLGDDANEQVEKMRTGDHAQQMEVIQWLSERIRSMKDSVPADRQDDGPDENGVWLYHPIRLSPEALGTYPNMNMLPTCLAVSTIVSGFFEKAGMTYMHGGVAMSGFGGRMSDGMMLFDSVEKLVGTKDSNKFPSPIVADKMADSAHYLYEQMVEDNGYHAAVAVRLTDGTWVMVDPYGGVIDEAIEGSSDAYEKIYRTLDEFRDTAPGLELSHHGQMLTLESGLRTVVDSGLTIMQRPEAIGSMLQDVVASEEGREKVYNEHILPLFRSIAEQDEYPDAAVIVKMLLKYSDEKDDVIPDFLWQAYDEALWKYVIWEEKKREVVVNRMAKDKRYLMERIVDMSYLPTMMCAVIASRNLRESYVNTIGHEKMEFGLPYTRVGYSVLSDFASYTDDELPPSFWFSHWGSLVPVTETLPRGGATQYQRDLQGFMANWTSMKYLTYIKAYPIINEFLSAQSSKEEDENGKSEDSA